MQNFGFMMGFILGCLSLFLLIQGGRFTLWLDKLAGLTPLPRKRYAKLLEEGTVFTIATRCKARGWLALVDEAFDAQSGFRVMHFAARQGRAAVIRDLVQEFGASTRVVDNHGNTPLHIAALYDQWVAVGALIDCKAAINSPNADGLYPQQLAAVCALPAATEPQ